MTSCQIWDWLGIWVAQNTPTHCQMNEKLSDLSPPPFPPPPSKGGSGSSCVYVETNFCFPRGYHLVGTLTRRSILPVKASITMDTTLNFHGHLQALFTRVVFLYRPQTKLRKCNVFTPVCDSVQGGRDVHTSCRHTPHPPLGRPAPTDTHTARQTPPHPRPLQWTVCTLLECILVLKNSLLMFTDRKGRLCFCRRLSSCPQLASCLLGHCSYLLATRSLVTVRSVRILLECFLVSIMPMNNGQNGCITHSVNYAACHCFCKRNPGEYSRKSLAHQQKSLAIGDRANVKEYTDARVVYILLLFHH